MRLFAWILFLVIAQAATAASTELSDVDRQHMEEVARRYVAIPWETNQLIQHYQELAREVHPDIVELVNREFRNYLAGDEKGFRKHRKLIKRLFPCVTSLDDFTRLSEADFFAVILANDITQSARPDEVVSHIVMIAMEENDLAHVLLRSDWQTRHVDRALPLFAESDISVVTFKRAADGWKLLIPDPTLPVQFALDGDRNFIKQLNASSFECPG